MNRRSFVQQSARVVVAAGVFAPLAGCAGGAARLAGARTQFDALRDMYFLRVLELNPVASMFLSGSAFDPALQGVNGRLRDFRPEAINREVQFFREVQRARNAIRPEYLQPDDRIDHAILGAQVSYILHQLESIRYYERCVDTYVMEPFRGVDWQIQQMESLSGGLRGEREDWLLVLDRTLSIPAYLEAARANLAAGKASGNVPAPALVEREGIAGSRTNADYFRARLPALAQRQMGDRDFAAEILPRIQAAGAEAGTAFDTFAAFLMQTYDIDDRRDQFAAASRGATPDRLGAAEGAALLAVTERVVRAGYREG